MYSKAENDVVTYLKMGLSNLEIAERLFVCEKTVKFHLTNIYKKSNVTSRMELIAKENGISSTRSREEFMELGRGNKPVESKAVVIGRSQEDKITFIDEKFRVGDTITTLHNMMKEVTKDEISPSTVNAACNCVARLNETINTAIQAAKFLNER